MTVEDLMKRRVIVENLYPGCEFEVNEILYVNDKGTIDVYEDWGKWELEFKNYPYLFRELNWWEDREENDMPEYIKTDGRIFKVKEYEQLNCDDACVWFVAGPGYAGSCLRAQVFPATKEEYENQQK